MMFNFPKFSDVFRPYLKDADQLAHMKETHEGKLKDFNDLRQLSETSIGNLSFEELFLPYDFVESVKNYQSLNATQVDDILEKYVILKYIISDSPFKYLKNKVSYFDCTIFGNLIQSKYKNTKQLLMRIDQIEAPYQKLFSDFHNAEINKILLVPRSKEKSSKITRFFKQI